MCIRDRLKAEGFQLTLTGYDLEMGIVTTIEANIKEPGEIVLNAKLLSSMISRMPAGQISIVAADNGKTTIQSGVAQFEICLLYTSHRLHRLCGCSGGGIRQFHAHAHLGGGGL